MANRKYAIRLNLLIERNVIKKKCFCQHQLCHGWFIPSRVGQETCLFDLSEKGLLNLYPMINITKYEVQNRETGEIFNVDMLAFGNGFVDVTFNGSTVQFKNTYADGNLEHELYEIREKEQ